MATEHPRWKSDEGNWFDTEVEAKADEIAMLLARILKKFNLNTSLSSVGVQASVLEDLSESICNHNITQALQIIEILKGRSTIKTRRTSK